MPRPLCWWDGRNSYQQYFVMPSQKAICRGGGASSSQRETQSLFGLTFSLVDSQKRIPTHILVYDRHNMLLFVNTVKRLCLVPYDMGSNYDLPYNTVRQLLRNVLKATTSGEIGRIEAVSMTRKSEPHRCPNAFRYSHIQARGRKTSNRHDTESRLLRRCNLAAV